MSSLPLDYEILDFEPIEEVWNEYELSDGNRIKGRLILTTILQRFDKDPNKSPIYEAEKQKFFVTYAPVNARNQPKLPQTQEEYDNANKIPVKVLTNNERWNVYRIIKNGQILKSKLIVDEIYRLESYFNESGLPMYLIYSGETLVPAKNSKTYAQ